jgi:hypothetical protein
MADCVAAKSRRIADAAKMPAQALSASTLGHAAFLIGRWLPFSAVPYFFV